VTVIATLNRGRRGARIAIGQFKHLRAAGSTSAAPRDATASNPGRSRARDHRGCYA
jgi:hypothetical protein